MTAYTLPKTVSTEITRRLMPLGLSRRATTQRAINAIILMIGRVQTAPRNFDSRADGQGDDPGFVLDRRALSGPNAPQECRDAQVTENGAREAIRFLELIGVIERITPRPMLTLTDRNNRKGWWLKAKKTARGIRAAPIRWKLTAKLASLFRQALGRHQRVQPSPVRPPVGMIQPNRITHRSGDVGVSTGDRVRTAPVEADPPAPRGWRPTAQEMREIMRERPDPAACRFTDRRGLLDIMKRPIGSAW